MATNIIVQGLLVAILAIGALFLRSRYLLNRTDFSQRLKRNLLYGCPHYRHKDIIFGSDFQRAWSEAISRGDSQDRLRQNFAKYGRTYEVNSNGKRVFHTCDTSNALSVLSVQSNKFGIGTSRAEGRAWLGRGVTTTDGECWRSSRALLKPIFAKAEISDLDRLNKHLVRLMEELARRNYEIDLQPLFIQMYLDYSIDLLFGADMNTFDGDLSKIDAKAFIKACDDSLLQVARAKTPWLLRWYYGWTKTWNLPYLTSQSFVDQQINSALKTARNLTPEDDDARSSAFVDYLIQETGSTDRVYLRSQMLNIFFPARDTSGLLVGMIIFHLARHPALYAKVRAEVLASDQELSYSNIKNLTYTNAVVNETLRLTAPASRMYREVLADVVLPSGGGVDTFEPISVPKGSAVIVHSHAMHRDPVWWGADVDAFRPERWLDISTVVAQRRSWAYLPFSGGPRICPAQAMVVTHMAFILARFATTFREIRNMDPEMRLVERHRMLMSIQNGVQVKLIT